MLLGRDCQKEALRLFCCRLETDHEIIFLENDFLNVF